MLAVYVHDLSPFIFEFGSGFGLRWYGLAYAAAFVLGYLLYKWLAKRGYSDLKPEAVGDFILWGGIFGVLLGGRVGYILFYNWEQFTHDPLIVFRVWEGGMASHGGILGLVLYTLWYAWRHKVSWLNIGDNLVVVAPIGLFLGRCANFINGELYGRITNVPWAMKFPDELRSLSLDPQVPLQPIFLQAQLILGAPVSVDGLIAATRENEQLRDLVATVLNPRHPSQLYEAFLEGLVLFAILWVARTCFRLPNGIITGLFFVAYAILRIIGEVFREPDAALTLGMSRGQFLSLFLILIGIAFWIGALLRKTYAPRFQKQTG